MIFISIGNEMLETFDFRQIYTTEQVAWVVANFPQIKGMLYGLFMNLRAMMVLMRYGHWKAQAEFELAGNENRVRKC